MIRASSAAAACALIAILATDAGAIPVPGSAWSRATGLPPALTDGPAVAFLYPQVGGDAPPTLATLESGRATSVEFRSAGNGLAYRRYSQPPRYLITERNSPYFQAAWTRSVRNVRLGAAFSWGNAARKRAWKAFDPDTFFGEENSERDEFESATYREYGVGAGWGSGTRVDLVAGLRLQSAEIRDSRSVLLDGVFLTTQRQRIILESDHEPFAAARIAGSVAGMDALFVARISQSSFKVSALYHEFASTDGVVRTDETTTFDDPVGRTEWEAGVRIGRTDSAGRGTFAFLHYDSVAPVPFVWTPSRTEFYRTTRFRREGKAGISLTRPGPGTLIFAMGGGVRWALHRRIEDETDVLRIGRRHHHSFEDEIITSYVAWGIRYVFRDVLLSAAVSNVLEPLGAFYSVDASIPLGD